MCVRFCIFIVLLFSSLSVVSNVESKQENCRKLHIGVLRHLTVQEAEQISADAAQAEKLLFLEAEERGHRIEFVNPQHYVCSTDSHCDFDVIISRAEIDDFNDPLTDSYLRALDYFEALGVPVINSSSATLNAQDKFRTLLLAHKAGVQIPLTFVVHSHEAIDILLRDEKIQFPFFVKKNYGGCGKGVFLIESQLKLREILSQHFLAGEPILVEERIDLETDEYGNVKDMRIWVARDAVTNRAKFVGGAYRTASSGNYLTNTSAGGKVSRFQEPYDPKVAFMAEQALESIGGDVAGIDIARDKQGDLYLIEVNISFYTGKVFQEAIGVNVWKLVVDLAEARVNKNK